MVWMGAGVSDEKWKWLNCVSRWLQPTEHLGQDPEQTNVCHFKQWVSSRENAISPPSQKFTKTLGLLFVYDKTSISGLYLDVVSHASLTMSESHVPQDLDIWHDVTLLASVTQPLVSRASPTGHILVSITLTRPWVRWGRNFKLFGAFWVNTTT